jgi:protein O-mannosyl-transferase
MKKLLFCLALAGAIGVAYYNALENDFVFDDYMLVAESPMVRSTAPLSQFLLAPTSFGYRPFRNLSYIVDARLGGIQPWVFHLSNLIYHWLCACLVFLVALRLTNTRAESSSPAPAVVAEADWRWRPAIFVTALWALHPVLTDAVTYISGRRDILGGLCVFFGLWTYLRFRASTYHNGLQYGWLFLSCFAYGLGILSKESAIVLPLLCWLADVQQEGFAASLRRRWALYFLVLLIGAAVLWHFAGPIFWETFKRSTWYGGGIAGNFATVVRIWVHYLGLMVFPHTLIGDYSYNAFPASTSFAQLDVLLALAVLAGVAAGITLLARRLPLCGYGGLWMVVSILPLSHIVPIKEIVAEHYLYVPLFGFCLIVGVGLDALCGRAVTEGTVASRWRAAAVCGLLLCLLAAAMMRTMTRNRDWVNEEIFWSVTTQTAPQSARAHYNLAGVYKRQQRAEDAAREFMATLAISPQHADAIVGLGELQFELRNYGQALGYAVQAQKIAPQNPRMIYLLSWVKLAIKDVEAAEQLFQQAAVLMPNSPGVYAGLEAVAKERGDKSAEARWAEKRRALTQSDG